MHDSMESVPLEAVDVQAPDEAAGPALELRLRYETQHVTETLKLPMERK
jgi:hypothetical protein